MGEGPSPSRRSSALTPPEPSRSEKSEMEAGGAAAAGREEEEEEEMRQTEEEMRDIVSRLLNLGVRVRVLGEGGI